MNYKYKFKSQIKRYVGPAAWYFVKLDEALSALIKAQQEPRPGFGSVRVVVKVGETEWKTSLFPDKLGFYVLAVKAEVRKKEQIQDGDFLEVQFSLA
jgi:hypothetical protein